MLERRSAEPGDRATLAALKVHPHQRDLVTANLHTLAEAHSDPDARVWGLWLGDVAVGLMAMITPGETRAGGPSFDPGAAYLWRLMIAADHQGQRLGAQALDMAIATARDWRAPRLLTGVSDVPHSNRGFYERFGFRDTGLVEEGDRLMLRDLATGAGVVGASG